MLAKPVHEQRLLIFVKQCKTSFQKYWYLEPALTYKKAENELLRKISIHCKCGERQPDGLNGNC